MARVPWEIEKEEEYALPPLGLLPLLAEGKVTPERTIGPVVEKSN